MDGNIDEFGLWRNAREPDLPAFQSSDERSPPSTKLRACFDGLRVSGEGYTATIMPKDP
jgi:hypothetical protein